MNDFLPQFRHLLVSLLILHMTSLNPPGNGCINCTAHERKEKARYVQCVTILLL